MPETVDIIVIGGGVVGCAVARRFALEGARVLLLEKGRDILSGASKANSALLHTGFDAPPGSLELSCMQEGYREYLDIHGDFGLPLLQTGAIVAAWSEEDEGRFGGIEAKAQVNGVRLERLGRSALLAREPNLSGAVRAGLLVPGEHVIDPWSAPLAYLRQALALGARALFEAEVRGGRFDGATWRVDTSQGEVAARTVINAAGLYGDIVERLMLGEASFTIEPRKGQFVVFDKAASRLLGTIILPVPTERTKGVVLAPTVFGNLLVGPTAETQPERDRAAVTHEALAGLVATAAHMIPALANMPVTATYAGLRPATERPEYRVNCRPEYRWITLGGIRSTGLTAALGLARHAYELYLGFGERHEPCACRPPSVPNLAEHRPRDWAVRGGEIVCHCELVTRAEIEEALGSSPPPADLAGLKRRTRATMGRCQGFYCLGRLAEITRGRLGCPLVPEAAE